MKGEIRRRRLSYWSILAAPTRSKTLSLAETQPNVKRQLELMLADGTIMTRPLSEVVAEIDGYVEYHTSVFSGE